MAEHPQTPPLLALPAEIRTQIWSLLLESQHIHVRYASSPTLKPYLYHVLLPLTSPPLNSADVAHRRVPVSPFKTLTPLWLVNRSLYNETCNLPFSSSNIWSFDEEATLHVFLTTLPSEKAEGITQLWLGDDAQSAAAMEVMATSLRPLQPGGPLILGLRLDEQVRSAGPPECLSQRGRGMTVYIPSRCGKLEVIASDQRVGARHITERLRAGWELENERKVVEGIRGMWERMVGGVVVVEV